MEEESTPELQYRLQFVRLMTGDDVITELAYNPKEKAYIFKNPLKIIYAPTQTPGVVAIGLFHWVFSKVVEKREFIIFKKDILTIGDVTEFLTQYYAKALDELQKEDKNYKVVDASQFLNEDFEQTADLYLEDEEEVDPDEPKENFEYVKKMFDDMKLGKKKAN